MRKRHMRYVLDLLILMSLLRQNNAPSNLLVSDSFMCVYLVHDKGLV